MPTILGVNVSRVKKNSTAAPPQVNQAMDTQGMSPATPFSPGQPIQPYSGYSVEPRQFDFRTGVNITARPRQGRVSFDALRDLTSVYDVARMCIAHRIDSLRSFEWSVVPADDEVGDLTSAVVAGRKALAKPDGRTPYASWIAMYLEDVLRYDAGTIFRRRNRAGKVIALEILDGTSIAPMLDEYGRRPESPAPAFVQYANGLPWDWLTDNDLIYLPYRPQPDSPYGLAPMETTILTANTDLRLQQHLLEYWAEGSIPGATAEAPPDQSDPAQVRDLQNAWNAWVEGDQSQKVKVRWLPAGSRFTQLREGKFDADLALWLFKKTCAAFSVTPQDLGLTLDVNRANGETQMDIQERIGDRPLALHIESILTSYLQDDLGLPVKMNISLGAEKEDRVAEAQAWKIYIESGMASVDEGRAEVLGLPVDNERPVPRFIMDTKTGPVPLESLFNIAGTIDPETMAPAETVPLDDAPFDGTPGLIASKNPGDPAFKRAPIDPDDPAFPANEHHVVGTGTVAKPVAGAPVAKDMTAGVTAATGITGVILEGDDDEDDSEEVVKALRQWRDNSRNRVKAGRAPRRFDSDIIPETTAEFVWSGLYKATTRAEVDNAFSVIKAGGRRPKVRSLEQIPGRRIADTLTDHYVPLITKAISDGITGIEGAVSQYAASVPVVKAGGNPIAIARAAARAVLQSTIITDPTELRKVIHLAYADAYLAGAHTAGSSGMILAAFDDIVAQIDWDNWKPGWADAAIGLRDQGLSALLDNAGIVVDGILSSTLDQMGTVMADSIEAGTPLAETAKNLRDFVSGDTARATMIAHTEINRAMSSATLATYVQNNVSGVEWLVWEPCPTCEANEDAGVIPTGSTFPSGDTNPPAHPRCRCSLSPATLEESP